MRPVFAAGAAPDVPLVARLANQAVLCVGAGPVAASKALPLLDAGAALTVVAPRAVEKIAGAARSGRLVWRRRRFRDADADAALLIVAATSDPAVNDAVARAAADRATLCVRVDGGGTAAFAGAVRRGPLTIAVSTGGRAPVVARRLRAELEATYGPEWGALIELLGQLRDHPVIRDTMAGLTDAERRARWRSILRTDIVSLLRSGRTDLAWEVAIACLSSSSD